MAQTLDQIVGLLAKNRQRATYGAVAEIVGGTPRTLMKGRTRDHQNSWVVAEKDGQPTGYKPDEIDPTLIVRMGILKSGAELEVWLRGRIEAQLSKS
jgi:hypothetical protein